MASWVAGGGVAWLLVAGLLAAGTAGCTKTSRPTALGDAEPGLPARSLDTDATHRQRRLAMVRTQIEARGVKDAKVLQAMREVPRHRFVGPDDQDDAYDDHPLGIGRGQTISQPYIVAVMSEALQLPPGAKVLEIGTGSGYQAAVLARLAREVYTIEIIPELAAQAERTLRSLGIANVHVRAGDGYAGEPRAAPFHGIMITAATPKIPQPLIDQLAEGGRLVAPVDEEGWQSLVVLRKVGGKVKRKALFPVRFVPMTGKVRQ